MNYTQRAVPFPKYSLAFGGLVFALLLSACGQEPPEQPPQTKPTPVPEKVLKVIKDRKGQHTAQVVQRGDKQLVVLDGQAGPEYDEVSRFTFSADGRTLAYEARRGEARLLVLGNREWPLDAKVVHGSLKLSPDSRRLALVGRKEGKWQVMLEGRPHQPFDFVFTDTLKFSPDSKRLGYLALKGGMLQVVVDGQVLRQLNIMLAGEKALKQYLSQAQEARAEKVQGATQK